MDEIRMAVEVREDEGRLGPGRLYGVVMPYGKRASDRPELFEEGSLTWPDDGIVLNRQHSRKSPVMRVIPTVVGDEVRIDQRLPDSTAGRDAATEIRQGLFKGLSIEFVSLRESIVGGVRRISSAALKAVALVDLPSYSAAAVELRAKAVARPSEVTLWL